MKFSQIFHISSASSHFPGFPLFVDKIRKVGHPETYIVLSFNKKQGHWKNDKETLETGMNHHLCLVDWVQPKIKWSLFS